jgi:hypothetical protein
MAPEVSPTRKPMSRERLGSFLMEAEQAPRKRIDAEKIAGSGGTSSGGGNGFQVVNKYPHGQRDVLARVVVDERAIEGG